MPVTVFDNGLHNQPEVYETPFKANLIFTPGALLRNDRGQIPADSQEVTQDGKIYPTAYNRLCARRLLPVLLHANQFAKQGGRKAFITIPGLGCGQFAGVYSNQLGQFLQEAIKALLEVHGPSFSHIKAVYYDPFRECDNERYQIHGIHFMVRPLKRGNTHKPQLCLPQQYQEFGDQFSGCELFSIVAWDHVSWPGNDFFIGNRSTDDGVKAAATNSMSVITGIPGEYDQQINKYQPPKPYFYWEEVVIHQNIQLEIRDNLICYPR